MLGCKHASNNRTSVFLVVFFRFMVGCGRCDDWFHGDCVGLDLAKVREMEEEDQMYVCLKCCEEETKKVGPEPASAPKPEAPAKSETPDQKLPPKPRPGSSQPLTSGGVRPVKKVSSISQLTLTHNRNIYLYLIDLNYSHTANIYIFPQLIYPLILIIATVTIMQWFVSLI